MVLLLLMIPAWIVLRQVWTAPEDNQRASGGGGEGDAHQFQYEEASRAGVAVPTRNCWEELETFAGGSGRWRQIPVFRLVAWVSALRGQLTISFINIRPTRTLLIEPGTIVSSEVYTQCCLQFQWKDWILVFAESAFYFIEVYFLILLVLACFLVVEDHLTPLTLTS